MNNKPKNMSTLAVLKFYYGIAFHERPSYFFLLCINIVQLAVSPFINIITIRYIVDELTNSRNVKKLLLYVAIMAGGNAFFRILNHLLTSRIEEDEDWFNKYLNRRLCLKSMEMKFHYTEDPQVLDQNQKAEMATSDYYTGGIAGLSKNITLIISAFITMAGIISIISKYAFIVLIVSIIAVAVNTIFTAKRNQIEIKHLKALPRINRSFSYLFMKLNDFRYGKDVRLYHAKDVLLKKCGDNAEELRIHNQKYVDSLLVWSAFGGIINLAKDIFIYGYLGVLAVLKEISIGSFSMLVSSADTFTNKCMTVIIWNIQEMVKNAAFMSEYIVFIEHENEIDADIITKDMAGSSKIEFKNVSFRYPGAVDFTLKNVNITIQPGEHLSVVGLNGAGKTTFIKLLCRLYDVTEGVILLNDVNINDIEYQEYIDKLTVVFQDFKLFAMTLKENVMLGDSKMEESHSMEKGDVMEKCRISGLGPMLEKLPSGLDTTLYKYFDSQGIEPSGGEAQKIAIARALYKEAPIVILDEPTAALDPMAEYEIYKRFNDLVGGKTAVYISHRMSSCKFCDRIAVFSDNTIKEYGTHEELMQNKEGLYTKLFQAQAQYYV